MPTPQQRKQAKEKRRAKRKQKERHPLGLAPFMLASTPAGMKKMSEILVDFAQPMLADLSEDDGPEECERRLEMAALIWNGLVEKAMAEANGREAVLPQLLAALSQGEEESDDALERLVAQLEKRKKRLFPNETRLVETVKVWDDGCEYRVNVASSLPLPGGRAD